MSKVAVVYWSGTGNTEAMANAVAEGAKEKGAEVTLFTASEFSSAKVAEFDGIAFGCPAMGAENLEESEFEPMFTDCEAALSGKKIALFGSYGWGSGEWMDDWAERSRNAGADLSCDPVICNEAPDDEAVSNCKDLGASPGYYRKHDQDMETLADLTKRAKGDERSINEFARVCGVSPSTISRLINKKNTTPNKDSLIKAIADNAVPEGGVEGKAKTKNGAAF